MWLTIKDYARKRGVSRRAAAAECGRHPDRFTTRRVKGNGGERIEIWIDDRQKAIGIAAQNNQKSIKNDKKRPKTRSVAARQETIAPAAARSQGDKADKAVLKGQSNLSAREDFAADGRDSGGDSATSRRMTATSRQTTADARQTTKGRGFGDLDRASQSAASGNDGSGSGLDYRRSANDGKSQPIAPDTKAEIVDLYRRLTRAKSANAMKTLFEMVAVKYPAISLSAPSVFRWTRAFDKEGLAGLHDNRGKLNAGRTSLSDWQRDHCLQEIRSSKGKASWRQIHKNLLAAMEQKGEISTDDYIAIFMGKTKPPFSFRVVQARSSKLTRPKMQSVFIR